MKEQWVWVGKLAGRSLEEPRGAESRELRERQGRRSWVLTGIQVREGILGPSRDLGSYFLLQ